MRTMLLLCSACAAFQMTACAPLTPNLDSQFGSSVNAIKAQQTIDPGASDNARPTMMDATAARDAVAGYNRSFRAQVPTQNVFTIGVGTR